jgi:hypothetical protein
MVLLVNGVLFLALSGLVWANGVYFAEGDAACPGDECPALQAWSMNVARIIASLGLLLLVLGGGFVLRRRWRGVPSNGGDEESRPR